VILKKSGVMVFRWWGEVKKDHASVWDRDKLCL